MCSREGFLRRVQSSEVQRRFWLEINHNTLQMRRERPIPRLKNSAGAIPTANRPPACQEMSHKREVEFRGSTNRRVTSYSPALENTAPWLLQALFGEQVCNTSCYTPSLQHFVSLQPHARYRAEYPWDIIPAPGSSSKSNQSNLPVFSRVA